MSLKLIKIHLYGQLKKRFQPDASLAENTVITLPYKENECFKDLLFRLNLDEDECGDCFVNGKLAFPDTRVPKDARIGLFPFELRLIDGGQYIKGHGFVTKNPYANSQNDKY
ncbi:MAG: hypothetical protein JSV04_14390 [Candidatus Heimdallarchaeota archaeon]|nr:MAG: hypothetical protein JSV04_14390 [Candidatus Heimdallarchaeota archaeon]